MDSISPLDGRYRDRLTQVRNIFSELALTRTRCRVEILHCLRLDKIFTSLTYDQVSGAYKLLQRFDTEDFLKIKSIESKINHDVKAVELYLRDELDLDNPNRIHFGLTSEDVNNLAWSVMFKEFKDTAHISQLKSLCSTLLILCERWKTSPFPARTHGQHATPTTAGKEIAVFLNRLVDPVVSITDHRFHGKLNGATGTYAAMKLACPGLDWIDHERSILEELGLERNIATTQIEDGASLCRYLDHVRTVNNVLIDLCQDIWMYISYGYFMQRAVKHEVGSSTMPHKINPINFENAEGNLQLSNALLGFMTDKLSRSRMQRDLSGSTVIRNVGVALSHHYLALLQLKEGLGKITLNNVLCIKEIDSHPELLAEALQTVMRTRSKDDVYDNVKTITRGKETLQLEQYLRDEGLNIKPSEYIGDCNRICEDVINHARNNLKI